MGEADAIVSFRNPPVVEAICGVQFSPLPLTTAHFGLFWSQLRSTYTIAQDAIPLAPVVEVPDRTEASDTTILDVSLLPDLRRVFLIDPERRRLLQLQQNRFHHNWRRQHDGDVYPRFPEIRSSFLERWSDFSSFLSRESLPSPHVVQYELTYVNHIPSGALWNVEAGFDRLFPWLCPRTESLTGTPLVECALHYSVPECTGRLHVSIRTGIRANDRRPVILFDLTVRGAPAHGPDNTSDLGEWFGLARRTIVRSFTELTGPAAHQAWGREQ